jgi:hypothetical protein
MSTRFVRIVMALGAIAAPTFASAQQAATSGVVRVTPYVGLISFGSIADGPLGTSIASQPAMVYGAQVGVNLTPNVALVGNVGYASSSIEVGLPIIGGLRVGNSKALLYDGGLQLRLPGVTSLGSGVVPFIEGGAGAIRYEVSAGPVATTSTNFAANFGGGVDLQPSKGLGARLMAKDYVGKFDFREAIGFDFSGKTTHNFVVGVGLNIGF